MSCEDYELINFDYNHSFHVEYFDLVKYNLNKFVSSVMISRLKENMFNTIVPTDLLKILKQKIIIVAFNEYWKRYRVQEYVNLFIRKLKSRISKLRFNSALTKLKQFSFVDYSKIHHECVKESCSNRQFRELYGMEFCTVCGVKQKEVYDDTVLMSCPGCKSVVFKYSGCNHITCVCGTEFCFECGKEDPEMLECNNHCRECGETCDYHDPGCCSVCC